MSVLSSESGSYLLPTSTPSMTIVLVQVLLRLMLVELLGSVLRLKVGEFLDFSQYYHTVVMLDHGNILGL